MSKVVSLDLTSIELGLPGGNRRRKLRGVHGGSREKPAPRGVRALPRGGGGSRGEEGVALPAPTPALVTEDRAWGPRVQH